jgi:hypothetical protein
MKKLLLIAVLALTFAACSNDSDKDDKKFDDELYQHVIETTRPPSAGDLMRVQYQSIYQNHDDYCVYEVSQTNKINSIVNDVLDYQTDYNQKFMWGRGICPDQHPDIPIQNRRSITLDKFTSDMNSSILKNSSAREFEKRSPMMRNVKVTESSEVNYKNLRAQKIVMTMTNIKDGKRYIREVYISLDSIFVGPFQYQLHIEPNQPDEPADPLTEFSSLSALRISDPPTTYGTP